MNGEIRLIPYVTNEQIMDVNELPEGIKVIKAPEMWAKGVKGKNIKVAVLDTGCDTSHPDLKIKSSAERTSRMTTAARKMRFPTTTDTAHTSPEQLQLMIQTEALPESRLRQAY